MRSPQLTRALKLFGLEKEAKNLRQLLEATDDTRSRERLISAFRRLVRRRYHALAHMWHPDRGGDPAIMQLVNAQYLLLSRLTIKQAEPQKPIQIVVFVCRKQPAKRRQAQKASERRAASNAKTPTG